MGLRTDARVQAVAVWAPPSPMVAAPEIGGAAVGTGMLTDEQFQAQARSWLDDAVAGLPAGAERIVDREVVHGDAAVEHAHVAHVDVDGEHAGEAHIHDHDRPAAPRTAG